LPEGCAECESEISAIFGFYGMALPKNRAALLSYTHDQVISSYLMITQDQVAEGLGALAAKLDVHDNVRYFYVEGNGHVLLGDPATIGQSGVGLQAWLTGMLLDDPYWANVEP
jgi:hypothetical protein